MAAVLTHALGICNDLYSQILAKSNAPLLMNRQQCMLLSERLSEVKQTLQEVQHSIGPQSPNVVPAMQELVHVLLKTQKTIVNDCFCGEKWLETAITQGGDLKETFAEILFDLRWLCNILKVVVGQDSQVLQLADCDRTLCESEVNNLFRAAKKDQEDLKSFLLKGDHTCCGQSCCIERTSMECLATQLLKKLEFQTEFQAWSTTEKKNYLAGLSTREKTKYLVGLHAKNLCELLHVLSINEQDLKKDRELLGESGNGTVEKVDWLGESYAIKTSKYGSEMFLLQEIVNLSVVNHPNVMHLVCCVKEVIARSYIMERMNKSLSKMLENIQLSLTRRVDIMLQIAEGINSLHSMGLVHRDLKPDNILIKCERCGSESSTSTSMVQEPLWIAKVCDFGTTKMKLESTAYANQTIPIGTTMYMPPEAYQLESDDEKPKRFHPSKIDVYSFALICYSLLIGKPKPFQFQEMMKPSLRAWKDRVRNGHRPQLPKDSNCPCRLCTLIQRCWDGNPKKRPTFQDICTELRYIKGLLLAGIVFHHVHILHAIKYIQCP
jgi:hypothetical protein